MILFKTMTGDQEERSHDGRLESFSRYHWWNRFLRGFDWCRLHQYEPMRCCAHSMASDTVANRPGGPPSTLIGKTVSVTSEQATAIRQLRVVTLPTPHGEVSRPWSSSPAITSIQMSV